MKKFFTLVLVSTVLMGKWALAGEVESPDSRYQSLAQEAERNKELLEIWKDHVKTLTKERDAAYKQIEQFKAGAGAPAGGAGPMAQFGSVETQPLASPEVAGQMQNLQEENTRLRAELEQKSQPPAGSNRELQMQFSAIQSQLQQVRKELKDAYTEKDRLIQEKERALSQVERLTNQAEGAAEGSPVSSDNSAMQALMQERRKDQAAIQDLQSQLESLRSENEKLNAAAQSASASPVAADDDTAREARALRYENNTLKAKIEKMQTVQQELESTRSYFTPLVDDLKQKVQHLSDENDTLKAEKVKSSAENDGAARQAEQYFAENQKLKGQMQTIKSDTEEASNQINDLKAQIRGYQTERQKYSGLEEEFSRVTAENKSLQQTYLQLRDGIKDQQTDQEAKFKEFSSRMARLQQTNEQLNEQVVALKTENEKLRVQLQNSGADVREHEQKLTQDIERYRTKLRANLTDMKNLKSNFEAYLDSLVASFDERQVQVQSPSPAQNQASNQN